MGWATTYIKKLQKGKTVQFKPRGNSMTPDIKSGQLVEVVPIAPSEEIEAEDIVLCKVNGNEYLHFIKKAAHCSFQIGNAHGRINGWINREHIYGKLSKVIK